MQSENIAKAVAGRVLLFGLALFFIGCSSAGSGPTSTEHAAAATTQALGSYPAETITFDVAFPEPAPGAAGIALAARDSLELGPRDRTSAACASAGDADVGPFSNVGDITAVGPILVDPGAHTQALTAGGAIVLLPGATSTSVHAHAGVTAPSLLHATVSIPATSTDIDVPPGGSLSLSPGSYGRVVVHPGGQLTIAAGTYDVRRLDVGPFAQLVVSGTAPVFVYVVDDLGFAGQVSDGGDATRLRVVYLGTHTAHLVAPFRGTLLSPQAEVELGSGHSTGFFYATELEVGPDALVDAIPSPLTGVAPPLGATGVTLAETQGIAFSATMASVSDANASDTASTLSAQIAWGDGTTSAGTVTGSAGAFTVSGAHTYAGSGVLTATVTVTSQLTGAQATATSTVVVAAEMNVTGQAFSATQGVLFSGVVASVADVNPAVTAASLTATIDWGDGTTSTGTVTGAASPFQIAGQHTYVSSFGSFNVTVSVTDVNDGATAQGTTTATVASQIAIGGGSVFFSSTHVGYVIIWGDANHTDVASDFALTINWGDGSPTVPMGTTFRLNPGQFESETPDHDYPAPGQYTITFGVTDLLTGATWTGTEPANVAAEFTVTGVTFSATAGTAFTGTVANGTTAISLGIMDSSIDWGDGTTSPGTLSGSGSAYSVSGTHTYASPATYTVVVSVVDALLGAPTLTASSTANVGP
jgi:hypothetical protein